MVINLRHINRTKLISVKSIFKVTLKCGNLTRNKWVRNEVTPGQIVRDSDGRLFRVLDIAETEPVAVQLTTLKVV